MKKLIMLFASALFATLSYGQVTTNSCDTVYLNNETNIRNADPCINTAADYVLTHPLYGNAQIYNDYRGFILA